MVSEYQPLGISVNKIFKKNIKQLFEVKRLFYEGINGKVKFQNARLYVYSVRTYDDIS